MLDWLLGNWTEVLGFTTGAVCVVLAVLRNVWNYPIGLANNVVFIGLFAVNGLYATAGLQVVFAGLAIHGWLRWTRGVEQDSDYIGSAPRRAVLPLVLAGLVAAAVLAWVLSSFTDSTVAVPDAAATAGSLAAQYMLNRKWIQNWFVWLGVDIGYVWLYLVTGLTLTAVLYAGFAVLTITGYLSWRAIARRNAAAGSREPVDVH
ncbi:MAG: nicotinamide riboside transporter PnuC [Propionicimonas sp.]